MGASIQMQQLSLRSYFGCEFFRALSAASGCVALRDGSAVFFHESFNGEFTSAVLFLSVGWFISRIAGVVVRCLCSQEARALYPARFRGEGIDNFVGWDPSQLAALDSRSSIKRVCSTWSTTRLPAPSLSPSAVVSVSMGARSVSTRSRSPRRSEGLLVREGPRCSTDGNGVLSWQLSGQQEADTCVRYSVLRGASFRSLF